MAHHLPTRMFRNVDFRVSARGPGDAIEYERAFRLATAEIMCKLKNRRGVYRRKTTCRWPEHIKDIPGRYRKPRRLQNWYGPQFSTLVAQEESSEAEQ